VNPLANKQNNTVLILLALLLVPYLLISIYCQPIADDFTYSIRGKENPLWPTLQYEYMHWNGRYFSNILVLLNPLAFDSIGIYKFIPIVLILATLASFLLFVYALCYEQLSKKIMVIISLILTLLYLYQMPIISEGIYWYTGAVTYQGGNILLLFFIALFILSNKGKYILRRKVVHHIVSGLLLVCTIGSNEISMLMSCSILLFTTVLLWLNKSVHFRTALLFLLLALICSAAVYLAPGNDFRESLSAEKHHFFHSLFYSAAQTARFSFKWIASLPLLAMSILYYFVHKENLLKIALFKHSFHVKPIYSLLSLLMVIFISVFPAYWTLGILGQHRTLNIAYFLFLILWFINLSVWFNRYKNALERLHITTTQRKLLVISSIIMLVISKNGYAVVSDLISGKAASYNEQMNERLSIMQQSIKSKGDTIYLDELKNRPQSIFVLDINDNPEHWSNKGYSIYFKLENKKVMKK
jgi:hypothetical protein